MNTEIEACYSFLRRTRGFDVDQWWSEIEATFGFVPVFDHGRSATKAPDSALYAASRLRTALRISMKDAWARLARELAKACQKLWENSDDPAPMLLVAIALDPSLSRTWVVKLWRTEGGEAFHSYFASDGANADPPDFVTMFADVALHHAKITGKDYDFARLTPKGSERLMESYRMLVDSLREAIAMPAFDGLVSTLEPLGSEEREQRPVGG